VSSDPYAPHVPNAALHAQLLDALRSDTAAPRSPAPEAEEATAEGWLDLLPASATSRHSRAVSAALTGAPVAVDAGTETGAFVAGLLTVLVAHGADVVLLAGPSQDRVRAGVTALGVPLFDDAGAPLRETALEVAPDPGRWTALLDQAQQRTRQLNDPVGSDAPSLFDALAELVALRAQHVHPPLLAAAGSWSASDRERVADALRGGTLAPQDPLAGRSEVEVAAVAALPALLQGLTSLSGQLVHELSWNRPRTLADLARAVTVFEEVDAAQRTYVPSAFRTDLARAREVLTRQQRSFLSAEERDRRREVKRLGSLRHDGSFGLDDVAALQQVQDTWAHESAGAPSAWPRRAELARQLEAVRRALTEAAGVLPGLPTTPDDLAVSDLPALVTRAEALSGTGAEVSEPPPVAPAELDDLAAALPAGASAEDTTQFVRAVWLRALAEDRLTGLPGTDPGPELRELAAARGAGARAALAAGGLRPVRTTAPDGDFDVLVVVDAEDHEAATVLELAGRARQLVLVAGGRPADPGSVWTRATRSLAVHELGWPVLAPDVAAETVRGSLAAAVRSAGHRVATGEEVAGRGVDLLVTGPAVGDLPAPAVAVELDGSGYAALPTVRDREIARPAQLADSGTGRVLVSGADWFRDPRGTVRRITEALTAAAELDRARRAAAEPVVTEPVTEPVTQPVMDPEPETPELPKGLGSAADAEATVSQFLAGLAGTHPNVDQTPSAVIDAAVALTFARLGLAAPEQALLDGAMDVVGFRRRGIKVIRAFKESVQRSKKRMRGAGVRIS
jgi:hypothetical protein